MEGRNNSSNSSLTMDFDSVDTRAVKVLAYCLIICMSFIGNSLVITVIRKDRRLNTNINRFIVNMCLSDILMTLWVLPERITFILYNQWLITGDLGNFLCKMVQLIQDVSAGVSILSMAIIAFDRFFAIVLPFRAHCITTRRCYLMIFTTWLVSITLHVPYLFLAKVIRLSDSDELQCRQIWPTDLAEKGIPKKYYLVQFSFLFAFPLLSIAFFYTAVILELNRKGKAGNQNVEQRRIRQRENREVSVMLITVVVLFAASWAPINTMAFMYFFDWSSDDNPTYSRTFRFVADFLIHSNAAQNAIIYFTFNSRFKKGLKRIFFSVGDHQRKPDDGHSNGSTTFAKRWNIKSKRDDETKDEKIELTVNPNGV